MFLFVVFCCVWCFYFCFVFRYKGFIFWRIDDVFVMVFCGLVGQFGCVDEFVCGVVFVGVDDVGVCFVVVWWFLQYFV